MTTKRDQAIADVNAATAAENGVIKNQPLLYWYAVEQREKVLKLQQIAGDLLHELSAHEGWSETVAEFNDELEATK